MRVELQSQHGLSAYSSHPRADCADCAVCDIRDMIARAALPCTLALVAWQRAARVSYRVLVLYYQLER